MLPLFVMKESRVHLIHYNNFLALWYILLIIVCVVSLLVLLKNMCVHSL